MDFKKIPNINHLWGALMIEELTRCKVEYFCLAPGSRPAPLSVAVARNPKAKPFVHFDERGLAFHALGYAAGAKRPVVLICTSGTAVANFMPAVIEASKKKLPVIVLTADRPPELRQTGAVQTIDQVKIFGNYAKWSMDMPCPDAAIDPAYVLTTIDQAVYQATTATPGVIHMNCMFREPLAPVKDRTDIRRLTLGLNLWKRSDKAYTVYHFTPAAAINDMDAIVKNINTIKNGLIVIGKVGGKSDRQAVLKLATKLGWPIVADISSGLRLGCSDQHVIHYFDHLLLSSKIQRWLKRTDGVIHLGGRMTSKRYYDWVGQRKNMSTMMVLDHPLRNDQTHQVTRRIHVPVSVFVDAVMPLVKKRRASALLKVLGRTDQTADVFIDRFLREDGHLNEPLAARLVSRAIPAEHGLFLANSMPVRDMDLYAAIDGHSVHVNGHRGASGIDGTIAAACGFAQGLKAPVTLMIGDLAVLHDLNSLAMLKDSPYPVTVVILNNGGGGIFSFLPIAQFEDVFEQFFGTPHGVDFPEAARMFALEYAKAATPKDFLTAYSKAVRGRNSTIIEVSSDRVENVKVHKLLQQVPL